jgi:hypothetical protein
MVRKRIPYKPKDVTQMEDPLEFKENKCSSKAKKIFSTSLNISFDLWFDKHYHNRHQHGDDNGKRDGIAPETVEKLVRKAVKYLLMASSRIKGFAFINSIENQPPLRVVLKETIFQQTLNVVVETHLIGITHFEITVKTAMLVDDFRITDGQYIIDFQGDEVALKKFENKSYKEICNF